MSEKLTEHDKHAAVLWTIAILCPSVNYFFFYVILGLALIFLIINRLPTNNQWTTFIILCGICSIFAIPKLILYQSISDLKEVAKFFLFCSIFLTLKYKINLLQLKSIIFTTIFIDILFSIFQWGRFENSVFEMINNLLHREHHLEGSLMLSSVRALGIFSDTAEHLAVIFIFYLFFLSLLVSRYWPLQSAFGVLLCVLIIISVQSKTGFIALAISLPLALYSFTKSFSKSNVALFSLMLVFLISLYSSTLLENLEQLFYLVSYGFNVSSFDERQLIWSQAISASLDAPILPTLFGVGRGYLEILGYQSSVFDNDNVYILNTFGFMGVLIFIAIYLFAIFYFVKMKTVESKWLIYLLMFQPLLGFSTDFISSLKVVILIALIISSSLNSMKQHRFNYLNSINH